MAFDIIRIYAEPFSYNDASKCVLKKAGFTYEGTMRNGIYKNGDVFSYCIYSMLHEEMLIETKELQVADVNGLEMKMPN